MQHHNIQHQILSDKYELTGLLGAGANGQVYLARHLGLQQNRAVKCISKQRADRRQFFLEAEFLKSLKHPGIPIIYDIEEDDENYYLIEEYVQGESLEAYLLHQTIISQKFILQTGIQLCDIIGYLHARPTPVIYHDLKPEHIILYDDQIKIVDFGIASFASRNGNDCSSEHNYKDEHLNYGTLAYAAPEKKRNEVCDERVDIYGIGVILHELERHLLPEEASQDLHRVILKSMEIQPQRRYQTVLELKHQLCEIDERCQTGKKIVVQDSRDVSEGTFRKKKYLQTKFFQKNYFQKQNIQKKSQKRKNIAVIGSRQGIGATHFSISYTVYLNHIGIETVYIEQNYSGDLLRLESGNQVSHRQNLICCGDFKGSAIREIGREAISSYESQKIPLMTASIENPIEYQLIRDFGVLDSITLELEQCDEVILIVGGRDWEIEETLRLYERLCLEKHLIPIVNYGNQRAAKYLAKIWYRNIYCFPLDGDPLDMTQEKMQFFREMTKREGW